jgi:hypothetical protein
MAPALKFHQIAARPASEIEDVERAVIGKRTEESFDVLADVMIPRPLPEGLHSAFVMGEGALCRAVNL